MRPAPHSLLYHHWPRADARCACDLTASSALYTCHALQHCHLLLTARLLLLAPAPHCLLPSASFLYAIPCALNFGAQQM